jgi:NAD-dependent DNA ligase
MKEYKIKNTRTVLRNEHGQPLNRNFSRARLEDRDIDELIGLCKGIVCDGVVNVDEAMFLSRWLENNKHLSGQWPVNVLSTRIADILSDNIIDDSEKSELFDILSDLTGKRATNEIHTLKSSVLPLDDPLPSVSFERKLFCLTGKFCYGTRDKCEYEVITRGGTIQSAPTMKSDYLVVGVLGSSDWIHTTHGRKIEAAVEFRSKGLPISIIPEEHWAAFL